MKSVIASLIAVAGMSVAANAQLMKMLVSTDGVNFSPSVTTSDLHATIQVLVTVSYTGTGTSVCGFGSANFQPIVSNWRATDTLLPMRQGGNTLPTDGSGMVQPQFYTGVTAGDGPHVQAGYTGGYGRVNPMGRTYLGDAANNLVGFVHNNPDASHTGTFLRIAQAVATDWVGLGSNSAGGSGVNVAQLAANGRTTSDPDFWGNQNTFLSTDPENPGWFGTGRDPSLDYRRQNVEVFRFAFTLDGGSDGRDMVIDAPLSGQQLNSNNLRYMGFFSNMSASQPNINLQVVIQTGVVHVVPTPASLALLGLGGLVVGRRRR